MIGGTCLLTQEAMKSKLQEDRKAEVARAAGMLYDLYKSVQLSGDSRICWNAEADGLVCEESDCPG